MTAITYFNVLENRMECNMIWEIRKVRNGYVVTLPYDHRGDRVSDHVYVFQDYTKMMDKLQEILEMTPEKLNESHH